MTDTEPNTELDKVLERAAWSKHTEERWKEQEETDLRSLACEHVVGLYLANATKNANPSKSFVDNDKSVYDLVADSRHLVEYLKGLVD